MKRTMLSAIGIGMLAVAASPALADITTFTIDGTLKLDPGGAGATVTGWIACDTTGGTAIIGFTEIIQHQKGKGPQGVLVAATNVLPNNVGLGTGGIQFTSIPCTVGTQGFAIHVLVDPFTATLLHKGGATAYSQATESAPTDWTSGPQPSGTTDFAQASSRVKLVP